MHTKQRQTQNTHKQWEAHKTINQQQQQQQQNYRIRTDISLSYLGWGLKRILWCQMFALDSVRMEAS